MSTNSGISELIGNLGNMMQGIGKAIAKEGNAVVVSVERDKQITEGDEQVSDVAASEVSSQFQSLLLQFQGMTVKSTIDVDVNASSVGDREGEVDVTDDELRRAREQAIEQLNAIVREALKRIDKSS